MHALLKMLGLASDEYHHIVAQFNDAVVALEGLAQRKRDEAVRAAAAVNYHQTAKTAAELAVKQADNTAAKLRDLVA